MKPGLLLNENVPLPCAGILRAEGWEVLAIAEHHAGINDTAVMRLAHDQNRWLVTFDRDYGELVYRQHLAPPPLILLLRVPSCLPKDPAGWIASLYCSGQLEERHFCIYDGRTVRRRPFPIRLVDRAD